MSVEEVAMSNNFFSFSLEYCPPSGLDFTHELTSLEV